MYYAHVPKCGGSAIEDYLFARFGQGNVAFLNKTHHHLPPQQRWSRTSPQHIDLEVINRLFPADFFDGTFTVVRHPVARLVSAYHFQIEVEQLLSGRQSFSDWLLGLQDQLKDDPFAYDNHTRPIVDLVPSDAHVFYLEHGLDALVPWFDAVEGTQNGPRAVRKVNERKKGSAPKVVPSSADLDLITELYGADFERFGYRIDDPKPLVAAPTLSEAFLAERDADLQRMSGPGFWLRERLGLRAR